jgi:hypothetical protein
MNTSTHNLFRRRGVSLLETVLAASLLGGVVMTICGLSAGSLRSIRLNQEYEKAWDYIERQLTLVDMVGVQAMQQRGQSGGQFESLDGRIWHWTVQINETGITALYDVVIQLQWEEDGRTRRLECRTRMTAKSSAVDETQTDTQSDGSQTTTTPASTPGTTS